MKKLLTAVGVLIAVANVQAQTPGEKITLEASYGFNAPINPTEDYAGVEMKAGDYAGLNNLQLGLTYQINEDWGVRGAYMFANFKNSDVKNTGTQIHKLAAEAVYTLYNDAASGSYTATANGFILYAHAGLGLSINQSEVGNTDDFMANAQIGLKPTYQFDKRWSVFLNPLYIVNFSQHTGFDGKYLDADSNASIGSFYTVNLGVSVRLGK